MGPVGCDLRQAKQGLEPRKYPVRGSQHEHRKDVAGEHTAGRTTSHRARPCTAASGMTTRAWHRWARTTAIDHLASQYRLVATTDTSVPPTSTSTPASGDASSVQAARATCCSATANSGAASAIVTGRTAQVLARTDT